MVISYYWIHRALLVHSGCVSCWGYSHYPKECPWYMYISSFLLAVVNFSCGHLPPLRGLKSLLFVLDSPILLLFFLFAQFIIIFCVSVCVGGYVGQFNKGSLADCGDDYDDGWDCGGCRCLSSRSICTWGFDAIHYHSHIHLSDHRRSAACRSSSISHCLGRILSCSRNLMDCWLGIFEFLNMIQHE